MAEELTEIPDPWEPLPGETTQSYFAFTEYCKMGPSRTLRKVATHLGMSQDAVKSLSKTYSWVERSKAYDSVSLALVPVEATPGETLAHQYSTGKLLLDFGLKALELKKPGQVKASDIVKIVESGIKMMKDSQGLNTPGVNININSAPVEAVNELIGEILEAEIVSEDDE